MYTFALKNFPIFPAFFSHCQICYELDFYILIDSSRLQQSGGIAGWD